MSKKREVPELKPVRDQRLISYLESITPRWKWRRNESEYFVTGSQRFGVKATPKSDIDFVLDHDFMFQNFEDILAELPTIRGSNNDPDKQIWEAASYKVRVPFSETEYNLIIPDNREVYHKWQHTTENITTLCEQHPLVKTIITNKEHRIWLFRQFLELYERYLAADLTF